MSLMRRFYFGTAISWFFQQFVAFGFIYTANSYAAKFSYALRAEMLLLATVSTKFDTEDFYH